MVYKIFTGKVGGVFADLITVEVDASSGLPGLEIIGLPGSEVKEAKDRVRVALKNSGISIPSMKVVINLSPADEHKIGAGFDLPIAAALLGVFGHINEFNPENTLIIGALSLDGDICAVRGVLPIVRMAKESGFKRVILPKANALEGVMIKDIDIIPVSNLMELISYLALNEEFKNAAIAPFESDEANSIIESNESELSFDDVYGQDNVKRAAALAASGFHHLLITGPPGTGKSLIAKRIPGIMPPLTYEECLEVTTIHSVAGRLDEDKPFINKRPFFSPHHGASSQALIGGGSLAKPGLVSLCHRGILFLDEMPEFKRETLDMLRQPLEDGIITVSRAKNTYTYPANFMLVGAMNPCPCGYFPDRSRCSCTEPQIARYLSKISGPVLDRIDITVEAQRMDIKSVKKTGAPEMSGLEIKERVRDAVLRQKKRFEHENFKFNSFIPSSKMDEYVKLGKSEQDLSFSMYDSMKLSMRSFYKIMRVARTIADFSDSETVTVKHLSEACCYRFPNYFGGLQ